MNNAIEDDSPNPENNFKLGNSANEAGADELMREPDVRPFVSAARHTVVDDAHSGLRGRVSEIPVEIEVVIGRAKLSVAELMRVHPDQRFSLNKRFGEPVELLISGRLIGYGEIVADDFDNVIGVRMIRVVDR